MIFLLVALSSILADFILKYETILEYCYNPEEKLLEKNNLFDIHKPDNCQIPSKEDRRDTIICSSYKHRPDETSEEINVDFEAFQLPKNP